MKKNMQVKLERPEPAIMSVKPTARTNSTLDEVVEVEEQNADISDANSEETKISIPSLSLSSDKIPVKSVRRELNLQEKVELINESGDQSHRKLAQRFNISKSQVGSILKRKVEYLDCYKKNQGNPARKRLCLRDIDSIRHKLDNLLTDWIEDALSKKIHLSGPLLRKKALEFADEIGYNDFKASNGWLDSFKARNNVVFQKPNRGSSSSTPKPNKTDATKSSQNTNTGKKEKVKSNQITEENVGPLISDIVLSHSEEDTNIPITNLTETESKIEAEVSAEAGGNMYNNYMKYCDDGATKRLEETIRSDLTEAELGLKELIALSKDSDFKLKTVINQKQEKTELLQQKLQEVANLQCEINLLGTEEEHLTTSNSQILGKISTVEDKVKSCGRALDDIQVIQEQQKSYTALYNMVTNNQYGVPPNS